MGCVFSYDRDRPVALDRSYFHAQMGPEDGYLLGTVPRGSVSVALEKRDGTAAVGEIHAAPRALGVPFSFFTLFDEPYSEGTLVVRDGSGRVVARRQMEHGLSLLAVDVTGEGKVRGYRTELLRIYEECRRNGEEDCREPRPVWIDCPDECTVGLAGAAITLVATPAEGTAFAGWSGDCSGREPCEVVVDRQTDVGAAFVRSSS